jgi:hypothetical protein
MSKFEAGRREWIRRSTTERDFLQTYVGAPHPASTGGRRYRSRRSNRLATVVIGLIVVTFAIQLVESFVSLFTAG